MRDNDKGMVYERWRHIMAAARFFNAARHSVTDKFHLTYKAGERSPDEASLLSSSEGAAR